MPQVAWLIVTGAGASRELSASDEPLPLMRDWSDALIDHLENAVPGSAHALRLDRGLDGDVFEERLGDFLRWSLSLAPTRTLLPLGANPLGQVLHPEVEQWFTQADGRSREIVKAIHETVYQLFGQGRIQYAHARSAYGALFAGLGITRDVPVVYATTNYDNAGEIALSQLGREPDTGETSSPIDDAHLEPTGIVEHMNPRRTPLLHLHGKVGWYRVAGGRVVCQPPTFPYNESAGVPALLLPTPDKRYEEEPAVESLWREFDLAIAAQPRVIVIGHSLHDEQLIDRLRRIPRPQIAVSIQLDRDAEKMIRAFQWVRSRIDEAHVIPMHFGPVLEADHLALESFIKGSAPTFPDRQGSPTTLQSPA